MTCKEAIRFSLPVASALDLVVDLPLVELEQDPYPFYRWMREECPIAYVPETGRVWLLTWDLCRAAGVNDTVFGPTKEAHEHVYGRPNVMSLTGADHRVLRDAANAPVRPNQVTRMYEPHLRATTNTYLDRIRARGAADATVEIFEPLAQRVIGDVLGFSTVDDATLSRWFHTLAEYLVDYGRDPDLAQRTHHVKDEIRGFVQDRVPALTAAPDHTALSHLLHDGMPEGQVRALDDILPTVGVLIVGGFQEPAHLIASTLYGLLSNREQAELVIADPTAWTRPAIEEGLRWLPPFGMTEKLTTQDVVLGGVLIPAGTEIALVIGSANRDPERFARPDDFDIRRTDQGHVSFGFGSHFCIGHTVARALGQVALEETFATLPGLRLDPDRPALVQGWQTRAPKSLPVRWDTATEPRRGTAAGD
jgi:aromatic O-demethylase, cytochrome P450 subunit